MPLLVECFDELVFGAWSAAWPLIRSDLGLTYVAVGLLFTLPHLFASVLEPLLGLLAEAWDRRALVRMGGIGFVGGLILAACSGGFGSLLLALLLVFPASGAFVSLSQATLMDAEPGRRELNMARWTLAGSVGVVAGPMVLAAAAGAGLGWRTTLVAVAAVGALSLVLVWLMPAPRPEPRTAPLAPALVEAGREALRALRRRGVLRSLALLELADLMLDVLHGFVALYFVDVVGTTHTRAAFAVVVYTSVGLVGNAVMIPLLARVDGAAYVRASAAAMLLVFPAFLLVGDPAARLVLLAAIGFLSSGWYSVLMAGLYAELPGRGATVVALGSLSGVVAALLPFLVGAAAERFGLGAAMWLLAAAPVALLLGTRRRRAGAGVLVGGGEDQAADSK